MPYIYGLSDVNILGKNILGKTVMEAKFFNSTLAITFTDGSVLEAWAVSGNGNNLPVIRGQLWQEG